MPPKYPERRYVVMVPTGAFVQSVRGTQPWDLTVDINQAMTFTLGTAAEIVQTDNDFHLNRLVLAPVHVQTQMVQTITPIGIGVDNS